MCILHLQEEKWANVHDIHNYTASIRCNYAWAQL